MLLDQGAWVLAAAVVAAGAAAAWAWRSRKAAATGRATEAPGADAAKDTLTGLPLRGEFDLALLRSAHRADADGGGLCVLCIGIDGFDLLNETYGRSVGDAALQALAERLAAHVRRGCPLAL